MSAAPDELDKRLSIHEAVCAERYQILLARLGRIERIMLAVSGALIAGMAGVLVKFVNVIGSLHGL